MGMYTEIYARGEIKSSAPPEVTAALRAMTWSTPDEDDLELVSRINHKLFQTDRWEHLGGGWTWYFPASRGSKVWQEENSTSVTLFKLSTSLKNYDHEIEKFFDWIDPHLEAQPGEFVGYSLYEEAAVPALYFKKGP